MFSLLNIFSFCFYLWKAQKIIILLIFFWKKNDLFWNLFLNKKRKHQSIIYKNSSFFFGEGIAALFGNNRILFIPFDNVFVLKIFFSFEKSVINFQRIISNTIGCNRGHHYSLCDRIFHNFATNLLTIWVFKHSFFEFKDSVEAFIDLLVKANLWVENEVIHPNWELFDFFIIC